MLMRCLLLLSLSLVTFSQTLWADNYYSNSTVQNGKQSFYKWKDKKGVTHYSSTLPLPAEVSHTRTVKKVQTDLSNSATSTSTPAKASAPTEANSKPLTPAAGVRPNLNAERDESCQTAQKNLEALKAKQRIYQKTADGQRHFLTDQEMEEQSKAAQDFLTQNCQ